MVQTRKSSDVLPLAEVVKKPKIEEKSPSSQTEDQTQDETKNTWNSVDELDLPCRAFKLMDSLAPPRHSNFRVVCLIAYREYGMGPVLIEEGANNETVSLVSTNCAERVAVSKLVLRLSGKTPVPVVERVCIVSDAPHCLLPGPSCREILMEHLGAHVPVESAWRQSPGAAEIKTYTTTPAILFPYPCLYMYINRNDVPTYAEALAARCQLPSEADSSAKCLYEKVSEQAKQVPDGLPYPVYYVAGALFKSGDIRCSSVSQAIEYPSTVNAVNRLGVWLEDYKSRGDLPVQLLVADQWGILHAPFAAGRSYLIEHGFKDVQTLVHGRDGKIHSMTCGSLLGGDNLNVRIECLCKD